jgi:hypothetical protein
MHILINFNKVYRCENDIQRFCNPIYEGELFLELYQNNKRRK